MPVTRREVIPEAGQRGDGGVIRAGGVQAFFRVAGVEIMALRVKGRGKLRRRVHHAEVGGVGFVGAETISVGAQRGEVGPLMGGAGNPVHHHPDPVFVSVLAAQADHFAHRIERADDV